jgi:uncharacterized protein (TIGR02996 family)
VSLTADERALLAAIAAAPDDDVPRLVYADWLDESWMRMAERRLPGSFGASACYQGEKRTDIGTSKRSIPTS